MNYTMGEKTFGDGYKPTYWIANEDGDRWFFGPTDHQYAAVRVFYGSLGTRKFGGITEKNIPAWLLQTIKGEEGEPGNPELDDLYEGHKRVTQIVESEVKRFKNRG